MMRDSASSACTALRKGTAVLRNGEQIVEAFPKGIVQARTHRDEPDVGGSGVHATGQRRSC